MTEHDPAEVERVAWALYQAASVQIFYWGSYTERYKNRWRKVARWHLDQMAALREENTTLRLAIRQGQPNLSE